MAKKTFPPQKVCRALAKNAQLSPQKGRLVADLIRGLPVGQALERLRFSNRKAAAMILKILNSAIANAEENHGADIDNLVICRVEVSEGIRYRRIRFSGRGRTSPFCRRLSHILLELGEPAKKGGQ